MSYQVLARKWRPRSFNEMVGQEHVLKALVNALDHDRLHHAYLFTGTRGVGKTTVARILAKCLNCDVGVSSSPCGVCSTCVEINEGRFVDLIEVDAASRTKVEDTRELLDNVQYSPTSGRYKIYLIDEVHMLSNSSFNALLKTLEEPPAHVKFLLATTDPQKLPATILSRCLQFNLKNMSPEKIVSHLQSILSEEMVPFEEPALWQLSRAADGSMRDALSLTDQAIAFGNGKLDEHDVSTMLGTIDHKFIQHIVESLIHLDGAKLLDAVARFSEHAPDYSAALSDLQTLLHRVAIAQALPEALDNSYGDRKQILSFARELTPEDVQLFYQTALVGQRDLSLCSVPRTGFEMVLLRMLAFKPQALIDVPKNAFAPAQPLAAEIGDDQIPVDQSPADQIPADQSPAVSHVDAHSLNTENDASGTPDQGEQAAVPEVPASEKKSETEPSGAVDSPKLDDVESDNAHVEHVPDRHSTASEQAQNVQSKPNSADNTQAQTKPSKADLMADIAEIEGKPSAPLRSSSESTVRQAVQPQAAQPQQPSEQPSSGEAVDQIRQNVEKLSLDAFTPAHWTKLFFRLPISGVVKMTASNLVCVGRQQNQFYFAQDEQSGGLLNTEHAQFLSDALSDYFDAPCRADISVSALDGQTETPAQYRERRRQAQKDNALQAFKADPVVLTLQETFGATIEVDSVKVKEEKL